MTTVKNTVIVNGETSVVTVKTAGPQGPAFPDGDKGDVLVSNNGSNIVVNAGVIDNANIASNAAIAGSKIATQSITSLQIADFGVGNNQLAENAVSHNKILNGTILDADINASAAIALSKLATGALPTAITVTSANISDLSIVNADISASAAIAGTKINPDFGSQNIVTTGTGATGALGVTGNITVSGTVDGRDVAADGTKLDTVETNAKDDQTAAEIKTLLNSNGIVNAQVDASAAIAGAKISPDFGSQDIVTTGSISVLNTNITGNVSIVNSSPTIFFTDNNDTPDYAIRNDNGAYKIIDTTNSADRLVVNTDGHIDIAGNVDFGNGIDVTGDISVSGTVDGVDIATRNTLFGGLTSSSGVLTDGVTATTQSAGDNTTKVATTAFVSTAVSNIVDSAPSALNTLNELAAALGDDANFSTTVTNSIGTKMPLAGGQFTGNITFSGSQTVDGRDLSVDGSKLDGIESGATGDQTAAEIKTLLNSNGIVNAQIDANAAIAGSKILGNSITSTQLSDFAVGTTQLAENAVSTAKILDDAVTTAKIADSTGASDGVTTAKLATNAVTAAKIATNTITASELADFAVGTIQLAENAVTHQKIANGTIINEDINASAAIDGTKINPDFGSQVIATTGVTNLSAELRANGNIKITNAEPKISLVDSNNDDDFEIKNTNGVFTVKDATDGVDRFTITSTGNIQIPTDSVKLQIGADQDLELYHDSTNSILANSTGNTYIKGLGGSGNTIILEPKNNENSAQFIPDGAVQLYFDNTLKQATVADGIDVFNRIRCLGSAPSIHLNTDATGNSNTSRAMIGLANGPNHFISTAGPNDVVLNTPHRFLVGHDSLDIMAIFDPDGASELYFDNSKKFFTHNLGAVLQNEFFLNSGNSNIFFNSDGSSFYGTCPAIGRAGGDNFHMAGTSAGDIIISAEYQKKVLLASTNNTSGQPSIRMTVNAGGQIDGDFNDTSDANLKENINPIPDNAIADIKKLKPVTFDWKETSANNNVSGFIAQDVKKVIPNLINGKEWSEEDQSSRYTINTIGVVAHLTKALQEAIAKIETLEIKVIKLEAL